jgi:hypothetical protein
MATHAAVEDNVSLPVFASTQPHVDGATAAVQFDLPGLKCFRRPTAKNTQLQHTQVGQGGTPASMPPPQASSCACEDEDIRLSALESKSKKEVVRRRSVHLYLFFAGLLSGQVRVRLCDRP